jgi:hypothetical protein
VNRAGAHVGEPALAVDLLIFVSKRASVATGALLCLAVAHLASAVLHGGRSDFAQSAELRGAEVRIVVPR